MSQIVLIDKGPLVAYLKRNEIYHNWVVTQLAQIKPPLITCEAVIIETCFLLRNIYKGQETVFSLLKTGRIQIPFRLDDNLEAVDELMQRYQSVPMSLADACLVRMTELYSGCEILTLDSDFRIYRKNRNQEIAVMMPDNF